jgi:hypothetical protein
MTNNDPYQPKPGYKFSFGPWTVVRKFKKAGAV